ncbi:MAG: amino acid adenylation domain-containing protein, partial [Pseudomonadota bacterium]|nr:amino acid adenylation domain-containing protein [Pseudomonadota bacterium]
MSCVPPANDSEQTLARIWSELLGIEEVSVTANFFQLGGHSLLAARMINRLAEQGITTELKQVFLHPTVRSLACRLKKTSSLASVAPPLPSRANAGAGADTRTLASYAQARLWFLEQLRPVPGAYHMNSLLKLEEALDSTALNGAVSQLIYRHPALRTRFEYSNDALYQVVRPAMAPMVPFFDLSSVAEAEFAVQLQTICDEQKYRPIDLTRDSPLQLLVVKAAAEHWYVFLTIHHIVCDGWSVDLLLRQFQQLYVAYKAGTEVALPELPSTYQDYSEWQRGWLHGDALDSLLAYWSGRLDGIPTEHRLPLDRPRSATPSLRGAIHRTTLDVSATARLKSFLGSQDTSLFVGLKALFCVLLARYSGEKDIVIGTAVANRPHRALEEVVGYFANTLVLRQKMGDREDFRSLLRQARDEFLSDHEHQHLPFEMLVDALKPERRTAINPLFQIMLVLQNLETAATMPADRGAAPFVSQDQDRGASAFDLTLAIREEQGSLVFAWRYATDLFDAGRIAGLSTALIRLIESAVADPDADVHSLQILDEVQISRQMFEYNQTARTFDDGDRLIHELFEQWAQRSPEAVAVVRGEQRLTYGELEDRANALAGVLQESGAVPGGLVGILMSPSLEMVIAMLAILKVGAAYVPLDPSYPHERLQHMLSDASVEQLLVGGGNASLPASLRDASSLKILEVDASAPVDRSRDGSSRVQVSISADSSAYAIYTSGSTGRPKGVLLHHGGLVNHILSQRELFAVGTDSRVMQYASLSFDVATCEIFLALCSGAQLHVIDDALKRQPHALSRHIEQQRITHVMLIPSVLALLAPERMASVQSIIVGGETIRTEQADAWSRRHRLFNAYGPSEATICAVAEEYTGNGVAIGHPIDNMACYLLDGNRRLVPQGVVGELYLAGVGLAKGYLNQPELTGSRFIEHRFETGARMRLYRTGDMARRQPDGRIEFLGRNDDQVKVRGYRIETDEIASCIDARPEVKSVVVHPQALASGEKSLVAYVVTHQWMDEGVWTQFVAALRDSLSTRLPAYMLPSAYIRLEALPTLENGKVDRGGLPAPDGVKDFSPCAEPPRTATEAALCMALAEVLGCDAVDVMGNFFQLGGNSILAMKLVARIDAALGVEVPLLEVFEAKTIRQLALYIDVERGASSARSRPAIEAVADSGSDMWLSYQQLRIWFLSEMDAHSDAYNATLSLSIEGELDTSALEQTLDRLIERHTVLRTVIRQGDAGPVQQVLAAPIFRLARNDVSTLPEHEQEQAIAALAQNSAATP